MSGDGIQVLGFPVTSTPFLHAWWHVALWSREHVRLDTFPAWPDAQRHWTTPHPDREQHHLLARRDGEPVGAASVSTVGRDNPHLAFLEVYCLPGSRRLGVGTALLREAEHLALGLGRRTLLAETIAPPGQESPGLAFAGAHGYRRAGLEEKKSVDLAATEHLWDDVDAEVAGPSGGHDVLWWGDTTPEDQVERVCALYTRFLGEIPLGDVDLRPETWDAERLRAAEAHQAAVGRQRLLVAARAPDGSLVGYSEAVRALAAPHRCGISGTLVLPEHRGHALGLALKVRLHRLVREQWPDCATVLTGNAGGNAAMNAVNDRLGYVAVEDGHELQKVLPAPPSG
ncbi:GNAT family N-acetyltransferase [Nocardioides dongxiaopingii]|uniref:GNAT family N-acetyltransferase n=1 Tax=Nocardioides sp. S-1144 TaxID=2582905 RepID=UPI00110D5B38|nr:GNAT family N-acetyltransferase [Nocardioides sp. S-1144]QCW50103.1 GNAT family N-acetyltransferase [Nocardioides sp. S-1144]